MKNKTLSTVVVLLNLAAGAIPGALAIPAGPAPAASEQTAEQKAAASKNQETAAAFVRDHRNDIVFIRGKDGAASGFIASMRGHKVLISNAHVFAALKNATLEALDRSHLRTGTASVATGHDLMAMVVLEGGTGMPLATDVESEANIGDPVVVLGNATGSGVVNTLQGELVGIGPDRIEVNAPFEHGNSGSPIVDLRTGTVIGVATYAELDRVFSGTNTVRRFGYRIDSAKVWHGVEWNRFYGESEAASKLLIATLELYHIINHFQEVTTKDYSRSYETPAIRSALENYYAAKALDHRNTEGATRELLSALREVCNNDLPAAKSRFSYDYFQRELADIVSARSEFIETIDKLLQS